MPLLQRFKLFQNPSQLYLNSSKHTYTTIFQPHDLTILQENKLCTMIPGDGIGPEISAAVKDIFKAAGVSLNATMIHFLILCSGTH